MTRRLLLLLTCLLALRGPTLAQQPPGDPHFEEFKSLRQEFRKAMQAYQEPYALARTDEERNNIRLDPAKDPRRTFSPRFKALAQKADGTNAGAEALSWVTNLAPSIGDNAGAIKAYRALIAKYPDNPATEQVVGNLRYGAHAIGQEESRQILRGIVNGKAGAKLKAAALFALGTSMMDDRGGTETQKKEARRYLDRLRNDHASSTYAKQAEGAIYELENLQIGKVAPDFEATDENGKKFKLSDYRGKVVVVDFWGWW